jgi:DNA-binding NarL/FixJ family response regulator
LQELQDKKNILPVIVASNLSQEEDIARAKKLGARDYLVKSNMSIGSIVERIQAVINSVAV